MIKAGLVVRIERILRERKLTQTAAARLMGINQPKVSTMLAGQFRGYSVERLMRFLVAVGQDVEIVVKPKKRRIDELRVAAFFPALAASNGGDDGGGKSVCFQQKALRTSLTFLNQVN